MEIGDGEGMGKGDVGVETDGVENLAFDVQDASSIAYVFAFREVVGFWVGSGEWRDGEG